MSRLLWALAAAGLWGCGPASVSGVVDGDSVGGARSAVYDTIELDFGAFGEANFMVVMLTDVPDACEVFEDFYTKIEPNCEDTCDNYRDVAEEFLGSKSYWRTDLLVLANGSFETDYDYEEDVLGSDEFQLNFYRYDAEPLYDADACEDTCLDSELLAPDRESGNGGRLEIVEFDSTDDFVRGKFEVDMGGDEDLRGSFRAEHCDMGDWIPFL